MARAQVINGKAVAERIRAEVARGVRVFRSEHGRAPGLGTILVGGDPGSQVYVAGKHRACAEVGIESISHQPPADIEQDDLLDLVARLNESSAVDGLIVQLPLPSHLDVASVVRTIDPRKDVDGLTPTNAGLLIQGRKTLVPATPSGVMVLLDEVAAELEGAEAVIVGRSDLVGRPLIPLLLQRNATVTVCHSRTRDLGAVCRRADVLIVAAGRLGLVDGSMIKPGATVIDVGITRTDDGLVGDVDFASASEVAGAITPVPGGVGPMTIAMLLVNTLKAAREQVRWAREESSQVN